MVRIAEKVFICPKCRETLTTDSWSAPICKKCERPMRRDRTGREGVFIKS